MSTVLNPFARLRDKHAQRIGRSKSLPVNHLSRDYVVAPDLGQRYSDFRQLLAPDSEVNSLYSVDQGASNAVATNTGASGSSSRAVVRHSQSVDYTHGQPALSRLEEPPYIEARSQEWRRIAGPQLLAEHDLAYGPDVVTIQGTTVDKWKAVKAAVLDNKDTALSYVLFSDPSMCSLKDNDDYTPLHWAAFHGHYSSIILLILAGAKLNARTESGWTALHWSSYNGYFHCSKALIDAGARINDPTNNGLTAIHWAAQRGHTDIAQLLIDHGAEINCASQTGTTPLHLAARSGHEAVLRLLLDYGAEVNRKADNGSTPLHSAAQSGHHKIVRILVEEGARVNERSSNRRTALKISGNKEVKAYLKSIDATK